MPYISTFTYCENVQPEFAPQGVRQKIINPIQVLSPFVVPGNFTFAIAFAIMGLETKAESDVRITFESESGEIITDTNEIKLQTPPKQPDTDNPLIMQLTFDFRNVVLKEVGTYTTKIYIDGEEIDSYKIPVVVKESEAK